MGTKKDIGKVFKERFKDFEQTPDTAIWDSIASELDKKSSNRLAPLWYFFGGLIVLGVVGSIWYFSNENNNQTPQQNSVVEAPYLLENEEIKVEINPNNSDSIEKDPNESPSVSDTNSSLTTTATIVNSGSAISNSNNSTRANTVVSSNTHIKRSSNNFKNQSIVNNQPDVTVDVIKKLLEAKRAKRNAKNKEELAIYKAKVETEQENTIKEQRTESAQEVAQRLAANQKKNKKDKAKIAENKKRTSKKDEEPKTSEEREIDREESVKYEIAVSPYTSILSYGSLTKGSSIDDRLVNNPREAIPTVGYGIRAEYTLTERTRLRVGVGYAPLKYKTNNFQVSINNGSINIYELAAISGQDLNQGGATTSNTPEALDFFSTNNIVSIQQNISYLEVPLDFQYMFLNKRIGLSVSPGVSLFILNDNSIYATAESGQSLFIGRETNLNGLSLAFNLGLGAHYNLNSKWRLNVEPVFRYQLNPYSNSLSNFRPYYLGAQFGMSYKF